MYSEPSDNAWLLYYRLGVSYGQNAKLNELNRELQGRDRFVTHDQCSECVQVETGLMILPVKERRDIILPKSGEKKILQNVKEKGFHPKNSVTT